MKTQARIASGKLFLLTILTTLALTEFSHGEDLAFFEKKYQTKITGVKPIGEYSDPDQYYSAIAQQLGIPQLAFEAAARKYGWKSDDGKIPKAIVKRAGDPGRWQVMIIRFSINQDTKKPDPATGEIKMVEIDDEKRVLEITDGDPNRTVTRGFSATAPAQLPRPDGKAPDTKKPVKVFILLGQSNMVGMGDIGPETNKGTLAYLTSTTATVSEKGSSGISGGFFIG